MLELRECINVLLQAAIGFALELLHNVNRFLKTHGDIYLLLRRRDRDFSRVRLLFPFLIGW